MIKISFVLHGVVLFSTRKTLTPTYGGGQAVDDATHQFRASGPRWASWAPGQGGVVVEIRG